MEEGKTYRFGDIEELIADFDDLDIPEDIIEVDEDMQLVVEGWYIYVPALDLSLQMGVACIPDEEMGMFMPDFDVTVVHEGGVTEGEWIYYEQDGMVITMGNFMSGKLTMDEIMDLECCLVVTNKEEQ